MIVRVKNIIVLAHVKEVHSLKLVENKTNKEKMPFINKLKERSER
jgi:hypothetical protein